MPLDHALDSCPEARARPALCQAARHREPKPLGASPISLMTNDTWQVLPPLASRVKASWVVKHGMKLSFSVLTSFFKIRAALSSLASASWPVHITLTKDAFIKPPFHKHSCIAQAFRFPRPTMLQLSSIGSGRLQHRAYRPLDSLNSRPACLRGRNW